MAIKITSTKKDAATDLKIGIFGKSGTGKTSSLKTLPCKEEEVLVVDIEHGLEVLRQCNFGRIAFEDIEGDGPIEKLRAIIQFLRTKEGLNGYKWVALDSFTSISEKLKFDMEKRPEHYGLLSKQGNFDALRMYGELKSKLVMIHNAFLSLPNCNKVVLYGAKEKDDGGETKMSVNIEGSYRDTVMHELDEFYGMDVVKDSEGNISHRFVTNSDGCFSAKSRMSGGSGNALDLYEEANISKLIKKCYASNKK